MLKNKNNQNVTNYEVCRFILVNNKQNRFYFDRIISTIYRMLYYKCDIQFRLIIEIFRMFSRKENFVCYILVFILVCSRALWPVCKPSGLFASPLAYSRALWLVCEHWRAHHVILLYKFLVGVYSR